MNKKIKKEKAVAAGIVVLLIIATVLVFIFCPPVACFNKKFYVCATTKELDLHGFSYDWPMYYLKFFNKLQTLKLYEPAQDDLIYIPETKTLKDITLSFADITDASSVSAFDRTENLNFYGSKINFDGFGSREVKKLTFDSCGLFDLGKHGHFSSLEELTINNCFFDKEDFSYTLTYDNKGQVITDSSAFSDLAGIQKLNFDNIKFEDVSGFIGMANLQEIVIGKDVFSDENIEKLTNAGIKVSSKS